MTQAYNWQIQRDKAAFLAFEDGTVLHGHAVGAPVDREGEVVFNTGMAGYQEVVTDPSYAGQIVAMTYPEIGNYGFNSQDMESGRLFLNGLIVHNMNPASSWRSEQEFDAVLRAAGVPAIAGIDIRALTTKLRQCGTLKGYLHCSAEPLSEDDAIARAKAWEGLDNQDYASKVSCATPYQWDVDGRLTTSWGIATQLPPVEFKVAAYDFGVKWNILRGLRLQGMDVTVVPATTPASEVLKMKPDGVLFSNGPADPSAVTYAIDAGRKLVGKVPIMGICLGLQILGAACGAKCVRLKFGHHGCNHPVKNLATGRVEITTQNHNFTLAEDAMPDCLEISHINLNDQTIEGIRHRTEPMFALQYHPEAGPGPYDPAYLFCQFREMLLNG